MSNETRIPEALALLKGWCKKVATDDQGRLCILASLARAGGNGEIMNPSYSDDKEAVRKVILHQHKTGAISDFNDDPSTTFEMVEAILEKAALERGGSL